MDPAHTNQQIFLEVLLVETSSIWKFDENIQICKYGKIFLRVFSKWSFGLDIYERQ